MLVPYSISFGSDIWKYYKKASDYHGSSFSASTATDQNLQYEIRKLLHLTVLLLFFSYTYLPVYSNPFLCLQIIVAAFLAVAMAAPAELDAPVVAIVKSTNEMNEDGSYSFS